MMQQPGSGDYASSSSSSSYYYPSIPPNPSTNPAGVLPPPPSSSASASASAPPYSNYPDYSQPYGSPSPSAYPSYPHTSDPAPNLLPTAPSYAPPPSQPQPHPKVPPFQPYTASPPRPYTPEQPAPGTCAYSQGSYYNYDGYVPPTSQPAGSYLPPTIQPAGSYAPPPNPVPSSYPSYDGLYDSGAGRFDLGGGGGGGRGYGGFGGGQYDRIGSQRQDDVFGDGVYQYDGGRSEPYGARGTKSASSWSGIDDYGRSTSLSSSSQKDQFGSSGKVLKAVPKVETQQDVKGGVQKFRVKLLAESSGQGTMDVLCQIGLDGIRMLDPNTNRTLRIYPLENVTRWEATDSTYSFWSKSPVDVEPRRIRLQSNKYTTNTLLDTVAAATVQLKEMGGTDGSGIDGSRGTSDSSNTPEQQPEKKKGIIDWMNLIKPVNEEKDHWVPDDVVTKCTNCGADFGAFVRKHHCRNCGDIFCDKCTSGRIALTADAEAQPVRVCDKCMSDVTRRLNIAKEVANKPAGPQSHEDLARKLQDEMDKKLRVSTGSKKKSSSGSGRRMREVVCPTCTVHLQVELPSSGSETVECGVCQHPFLVSAR